MDFREFSAKFPIWSGLLSWSFQFHAALSQAIGPKTFGHSNDHLGMGWDTITGDGLELGTTKHGQNETCHPSESVRWA